MRIGFFGTPDLASQVLQDLMGASDIEVAFVVTNPDKPFGRDQSMRPSAVKIVSTEYNIPTYTPEKIRGNIEILDIMRSFACDYFVVVAYGKILPMDVLEIPKKMCINIHGSILPRYRGASPIQAALLHGETETGVTIMNMSEGMDEGDILKIRVIAIDTDETSTTLFEKFAEISGPTLIQTLRELETGGITPLPQDHTRATYCKKITKENGLIDWTQSATDIYHMWQAYTPWPGIYTMYEGKRLLLERVYVIPGLSQNSSTKHDFLGVSGFLSSQEGQSTGKIGQVIKLEDGRIGVICSEGILTIETVKLEGKKSQNIGDFLNGNQKFIGYTL